MSTSVTPTRAPVLPSPEFGEEAHKLLAAMRDRTVDELVLLAHDEADPWKRSAAALTLVRKGGGVLRAVQLGRVLPAIPPLLDFEAFADEAQQYLVDLGSAGKRAVTPLLRQFRASIGSPRQSYECSSACTSSPRIGSRKPRASCS